MSEYQYYEFVTIDKPLTRTEMAEAVFRKAELDTFIRSTVLSIDATDARWIFSWTLKESEDYDRFAEDDGSGWMRRLIPLCDELDDDTLEPGVPGGLADLYWQAASAQAFRGSASGYEKTVDILKVLAEGYALVAGSDAFDRQLRCFLVPHAKRAALLRRLAEAGLWSG